MVNSTQIQEDIGGGGFIGYEDDAADDDTRVYVLTRREIRYRLYMVNCGLCGQAQSISTETPYRDEIVQECTCGAVLVLPVEALRGVVHRGLVA